MIQSEDAAAAAFALHQVKLNDGVVMCLILFDTSDASVATLAPQGVDALKILQLAAEHHAESAPLQHMVFPPPTKPS
jgi:hypothetical protein